MATRRLPTTRGIWLYPTPGSPATQQLQDTKKLRLLHPCSPWHEVRSSEHLFFGFLCLIWPEAPLWRFPRTGMGSKRGSLSCWQLWQSGGPWDKAQIPALGPGCQESWTPCAAFACPLKGQRSDGYSGHPQDDRKGRLWNLQFSMTLIGFELDPWRDTLHLGRKWDLELHTGSFKGF